MHIYIYIYIYVSDSGEGRHAEAAYGTSDQTDHWKDSGLKEFAFVTVSDLCFLLLVKRCWGKENIVIIANRWGGWAWWGDPDRQQPRVLQHLSECWVPCPHKSHVLMSKQPSLRCRYSQLKCLMLMHNATLSAWPSVLGLCPVNFAILCSRQCLMQWLRCFDDAFGRPGKWNTKSEMQPDVASKVKLGSLAGGAYLSDSSCLWMRSSARWCHMKHERCYGSVPCSMVECVCGHGLHCATSGYDDDDDND